MDEMKISDYVELFDEHHRVAFDQMSDDDQASVAAQLATAAAVMALAEATREAGRDVWVRTDDEYGPCLQELRGLSKTISVRRVGSDVYRLFASTGDRDPAVLEDYSTLAAAEAAAIRLAELTGRVVRLEEGQ